MLLPYNVDRLTKRVPYVTYGLMGINIAIFLLTLLVANFSLPTDREEGKKEIAALIKADPVSQDFNGGDLEGTIEAPQTPPTEPEQAQPVPMSEKFGFFVGAQLGEAPVGEVPVGDVPAENQAESENFLTRFYQMRALQLASKKVETADDYRRFYVIQHAYDNFVDEPHYSVLNSLAYHPGDPSALSKIFTMFTAMFLHGSIDHLLGNMLFLWIFGRATEEFLGRKFYLSTYLLAGVAATLLQHIVTALFSPGSMGVPNIGASGAIAGVLGLFAVRFYRTKVRVFYLWGFAIWIFLILFFIFTLIFYTVLGNIFISSLLGAIGAGAAIFLGGRDKIWGAFRAPSVWVIGVWVILFNIVPALWEMADSEPGGVAHWAHLGGFLCGAAYALLIGGVDEGKSEYALEDAQTALHNSSSDDALQRARDLLQKDDDNPAAHEIAARAHDRRKNPEQAVPHYQKAIEGFWKRDERDAAARLYGLSLTDHPHLLLRPALLLGLSSHLSKNAMWNQSAAILTRLVEEFPAAPEAEIALLRAAQLWLRQFDDPAETLRMTALFSQMFPQSQWESQLRGLEQNARELLKKRAS